MTGVARFDVRVRFYELDPYGHVNHATYLQYFEAARVGWLEESGTGLNTLAEQGVKLFVSAVSTRFVTPAGLDDRLRIETGLVEMQRVRAQWAQAAWRDDDLVVCQRVNFACVNLVGKPIRIPDQLRTAMDAFQIDPTALPRELPPLAF